MTMSLAGYYKSLRSLQSRLNVSPTVSLNSLMGHVQTNGILYHNLLYNL